MRRSRLFARATRYPVSVTKEARIAAECRTNNKTRQGSVLQAIINHTRQRQRSWIIRFYACAMRVDCQSEPHQTIGTWARLTKPLERFVRLNPSSLPCRAGRAPALPHCSVVVAPRRSPSHQLYDGLPCDSLLGLYLLLLYSTLHSRRHNQLH